MISFKKYLNKKLFRKKRILFAIADGIYKGEFWVYMLTSKNEWLFFSMPDLTVRKISPNNFIDGFNLNIVERVSILPHSVIQIIKAQYHRLSIVIHK